MPTDAEQVATIRTQTLALLATVTLTVGPTYTANGITVNKTEYLKELRDTIAWCNAQSAATEPFELTTFEF